jgi:hypothetical protein
MVSIYFDHSWPSSGQLIKTYGTISAYVCIIRFHIAYLQTYIKFKTLKIVCIVKYFCRKFVLVTNSRWSWCTKKKNTHDYVVICIFYAGVKPSRSMRCKLYCIWHLITVEFHSHKSGILVHCCILCTCFRFRYYSLYSLVYTDTPQDDCGYSLVLGRSSLYCWRVIGYR